VRLEISSERFLSQLVDLFGDADAEAFLVGEDPFSRVAADGLATLRVRAGDRWIGVIFHDFRVGGGSFSSANAQRLKSFLKQMEHDRTPILAVLDCVGVRITEGRRIFANTFGVLPFIWDFRRAAPLITVCLGRALGLGAVMFSLGHYRLALEGESLINLTGPEVIQLFFRDQARFSEFAGASRHLKVSGLVQETCASRPELFARLRSVLEALLLPGVKPNLPGDGNERGPRFKRLLDLIGEDRTELFPQLSEVVRVYIVDRGGRKVGVFANPFGDVNNMISVATLNKYSMGLDLFESLGLPIISCLDSGGVDPRLEESDRNVVEALSRVGEKIYRYPHGTMGVSVGRAYGGATCLCFPRIFGSERVVVLRGSRIGIMSDAIISKVLSGSKRLSKEWQDARLNQHEDLSDLIEAGLMDRLIDWDALGPEVDAFLDSVSAPRPRPRAPARRASYKGGAGEIARGLPWA
jgi:acetyl-CoA carboxylase carboxyltransferase component